MGTNANYQQRPKIQPIIDVPVVLQMETVYGEEKVSKFNGLEYKYYVSVDGNPAVIYLSESGRDAIAGLQPEPGDYIELLKQRHQGEFVFSAQLLSDAQEPQEPPAPAYRQQPRYLPPTRSNGHAAQRPPQHLGNPRQGASRPPQRGFPARSSEDRPPYQSNYEDDPHSNGRELVRHQPVSQNPPPRPEASDLNGSAQQWAGCLRTAFDAFEELKAYALSSRNVQVEYTSEDLRAIAITMYIKARERGR